MLDFDFHTRYREVVLTSSRVTNVAETPMRLKSGPLIELS